MHEVPVRVQVVSRHEVLTPKLVVLVPALLVRDVHSHLVRVARDRGHSASGFLTRELASVEGSPRLVLVRVVSNAAAHQVVAARAAYVLAYHDGTASEVGELTSAEIYVLLLRMSCVPDENVLSELAVVNWLHLVRVETLVHVGVLVSAASEAAQRIASD